MRDRKRRETAIFIYNGGLLSVSIDLCVLAGGCYPIICQKRSSEAYSWILAQGCGDLLPPERWRYHALFYLQVRDSLKADGEEISRQWTLWERMHIYFVPAWFAGQLHIAIPSLLSYR